MERKFVRFIVWTVIIVGSLAGLARAFLVRAWVVPGDDPDFLASAAPTLEAGDVVLLWRLTAPRFGDLALCEDPETEGATVVGRLLAEGGDSITIRGARIELNGERSGTEFACDPFFVLDPATDQEIEIQCSIEALGGHKHPIGTTGGQKNVPPPVHEVLQEDEAYLVSDNRLYPHDSRVYGPVIRETCKESVVFRLVGGGGWRDTKRRLTGLL